MYKHARHGRIDRTTRFDAGAVDDGPSPSQRAALQAYNQRIEVERERNRARLRPILARYQATAPSTVRGKGDR